MVFAQDRDNFPKKCYYYDGNPDMYTKKAQIERKALKNDETVKNAITEFIRQHAKPSNAGKDKQYGWQTYSELYLKIGAILRPNTDTEDLQKLVKEDFERDCMDPQPEIESSDEENKEDDEGERRNDSDEDDDDQKPKEDEAPAVA